MNERDTFCFRPKRYGYGAEPKNWRGWLGSGLFMLAAASIVWLGLVATALGGQEASTERTALVWGALIAITAGYRLVLPSRDRWTVALALGPYRLAVEKRFYTKILERRIDA
jgi:hypothetical protein